MTRKRTKPAIRQRLEIDRRLHRAVGLSPKDLDSITDESLLKQILPPRFPPSKHHRLLKGLANLARAYQIDPQHPDWLAATLFSLALEHPHLQIVKKAVGRPGSLSPDSIASDRSFLEFVFKQKAGFEERGGPVSFAFMARKLALLHDLCKDAKNNSPLFPSGAPHDAVRSISRRITRVAKAHPDIVEKYTSKRSHFSGADDANRKR